MRALIRFTVALSLLLGAAYAQITLTGAGSTKSSGGGGGFTGAGDVVSGARAWWGLRAYSSADRGNRLINICDPSNVTCADWSSDATTGKLVVGTNPLNGTDCTAVNTCTIKIFYDRSGNNFCGAAACDQTQATAASRATFTWSCVNTLPCAVFGGSAFYTSAFYGNPTVNQPLTVTAVANRTSGTAEGDMLAWCASACNGGSTNVFSILAFRNVASAVQIFAGTAGVFISNISDVNFHAFVGVINGASSQLVCSGSAGTNCSTGTGTANSLSPGTSGISSNTTGSGGFFQLGGQTAASNTNLLVGDLTEAGFWSSGFNATQYGNMANNMYSFWGPF